MFQTPTPTMAEVGTTTWTLSNRVGWVARRLVIQFVEICLVVGVTNVVAKHEEVVSAVRKRAMP